MTPYEIAMEKKRRAMEGGDPNAGSGGGGGGGGPAPVANASSTMGAAAGARFLEQNKANPAANPPPARPAPAPATAPQKPLGARIADVGATVADAAVTPGKKLFDVANRALVGVRNIGAEAVGVPTVAPAEVNYNEHRDNLAKVRAMNARTGAPVAKAAAAAPAGAAVPAANAVADGQARSDGYVGVVPPAPAPGRGVVPTPTAQEPVRTVNTVRDASGSGEGYFVGSDGVRRAVSAQDGSIVAPGGVPAQSGLAVQPGAVAPAPTFAPPAARTYSAGGTGLSGNLVGADKERQGRISELDSQLAALGNLNSRGKRALAAQIIEQKTQLTRDAYAQQGELAQTGARLNVDAENTALGANARAGETADTIAAQALEGRQNREQQLALSGDMVEGENGRQYVRRGDKVVPVTGPDGKGFAGRKLPNKGDLTPQDQLDALLSMQSGLSDITDPDGSQRAKIADEIRAMAKLDGGGDGGKAPAVGTVKNGYRFKGGNPADKSAWEKVK